MDMLQSLDSMVKRLKSYESYKVQFIPNGLKATFNLHKSVLQLKKGGYSNRRLMLTISQNNINCIYDKDKIYYKRVVGITNIIEDTRKFMMENRVNVVNINLYLIEVEGYNKMWIKQIEFSN